MDPNTQQSISEAASVISYAEKLFSLQRHQICT